MNTKDKILVGIICGISFIGILFYLFILNPVMYPAKIITEQKQYDEFNNYLEKNSLSIENLIENTMFYKSQLQGLKLSGVSDNNISLRYRYILSDDYILTVYFDVCSEEICKCASEVDFNIAYDNKYPKRTKLKYINSYKRCFRSEQNNNENNNNTEQKENQEVLNNDTTNPWDNAKEITDEDRYNQLNKCLAKHGITINNLIEKTNHYKTLKNKVRDGNVKYKYTLSKDLTLTVCYDYCFGQNCGCMTEVEYNVYCEDDYPQNTTLTTNTLRYNDPNELNPEDDVLDIDN